MIKTWGVTDIGLLRRDNQDAYGVVVDDVTDHTVCVVCDGMGGNRGGGLASNIAVTTFLEVMRQGLKKELSLDEMKELTGRATAAANTAIRAAVAGNEAYSGMGTTLVSAVSLDCNILVHNIGDSRGYYISRTGIRRITRDHSLVETLVERGDITEEQARTHPQRNYITKALGPESTVEGDFYEVSLNKGDYILLCTDGLVTTVEEKDVYHTILGEQNKDEALRHLVELSKEHGAPDNITAVLLQLQ